MGQSQVETKAKQDQKTCRHGVLEQNEGRLSFSPMQADEPSLQIRRAFFYVDVTLGTYRDAIVGLVCRLCGQCGDHWDWLRGFVAFQVGLGGRRGTVVVMIVMVVGGFFSALRIVCRGFPRLLDRCNFIDVKALEGVLDARILQERLDLQFQSWSRDVQERIVRRIDFLESVGTLNAGKEEAAGNGYQRNHREQDRRDGNMSNNEFLAHGPSSVLSNPQYGVGIRNMILGIK